MDTIISTECTIESPRLPLAAIRTSDALFLHLKRAAQLNRRAKMKGGSSPPALQDTRGYAQTYLVKTTGSECHDEHCTKSSREVFFRCGNWCYAGEARLDFQHCFGMTLKDIPSIVPSLQRQQDDLAYLCSADRVPESSCFYGPLKELDKARDFVIAELGSDNMQKQLTALKDKFNWIDGDENQIYFELVGSASHLFQDILFIASKVYTNELIFITIFFEGVIYVKIEDGQGEQPLLDVSFPDVSEDGEGATLSVYDDDNNGPNGPWIKLSVWQSLKQNDRNTLVKEPKPVLEKPTRHDLSSDCYVQSYCVLDSKDGSDKREVMFRFGEWCYSGQVNLFNPYSSIND